MRNVKYFALATILFMLGITNTYAQWNDVVVAANGEGATAPVLVNNIWYILEE